MADVLIAALSAPGRIGPLLSVAENLVARGDRVTVMTGAAHANAVHALGARHRALPAGAEADDLGTELGSRRGWFGANALNLAIERHFLAPMPHQAAALAAVLSTTRYDAIIADYGFFGIIPFLLGDRHRRPPVLVYTPTPLTLSSRDTAPAGMGLPPRPGALGRARNRTLECVWERVVLRRSHRAAQEMLAVLGAPPLPAFLLDVGILADRFVVPTVPGFEYPRSDLPRNVRFVGAIHPRRSRGYVRPPWWHELDGDRPVVHVTQGSVGEDLTRLVEPTATALADDDVLVVATTGTRAALDPSRPLPRNLRVAEYIPHDVLLPKVDVMVTDGGYGGVQRALATGVPLVVAAGTECKPEVAARVAWSGAGIDLRTQRPSTARIRSAVLEVLGDDRHLRRARDLEAAFARRHGVAEITALVDEVMRERSASVG